MRYQGLTNSKVAEYFAKGETRGSSKRMFINEDTIYSYGYHFKIAIRVPEKLIPIFGVKFIVNSNGYSNSTAKHKSNVTGAIFRTDNTYISLPGCDYSADTLDQLIKDLHNDLKKMRKSKSYQVRKLICEQHINLYTNLYYNLYVEKILLG
jgi:hypothetical protein